MKIFTYTMMMLMVVMTMTSCERDEDADLAYDIEGVWQGGIVGNYYSNRYSYSTDEYDTEISFTRRNAYSGTGYEVDYNLNTRRYYRNYFDWTVRNGRIILDYDDGYSVIIRDYEVYSLRGTLRFRGYFDNYDTREQMASFNLVKVEDPNDYYYDRYSRYVRTRGVAPDGSVAETDSVITEKESSTKE